MRDGPGGGERWCSRSNARTSVRQISRGRGEPCHHQHPSETNPFLLMRTHNYPSETSALSLLLVMTTTVRTGQGVRWNAKTPRVRERTAAWSTSTTRIRNRIRRDTGVGQMNR
ncbi:unnamed protein product [Ectocarpus sp. 8 AP-2014]